MVKKIIPVLSVLVLPTVDFLSRGTLSLYDFIKYAAILDAFLLVSPGLIPAGQVRIISEDTLSEDAVPYGKRGWNLSSKGGMVWAGLSAFWIAGICIKGPFHIILGVAVLLFFLGLGTECVLRKQDVREVPQAVKPEARPNAVSKEEREQDLYNRILEVMERDRPWVNEQFRLNDLVSMVYSNRQAVSNAVNRKSQMNFCRFVNSYRVDYAKELVRKDPRLSVGDVSMMCGFHNDVSFSMAFQLVENMTPNEWIRKCRHGKV